MAAKWVHGAGDSPEGECLQCGLDDDGSVAHPAELDEDSNPEEPWCAICGHHIDYVQDPDPVDASCAFGPPQRHRYGLFPCKRCEDGVRHHHVPNVGCLDCGDRGQVP